MGMYDGISAVTNIYGSICSLWLSLQALYEDVRCKCVCPNPNVVNGSSSDRKLYIANVVPNMW